MDHIATLKQVLTDAHLSIDEQFHLRFTNASRCTNKHNVEVTTPRRWSQQTAYENHHICCTKIHQIIINKLSASLIYYYWKPPFQYPGYALAFFVVEKMGLLCTASTQWLSIISY